MVVVSVGRSPQPTTLGQVIRKLRRERGWSIGRLAELSDTGKNAISSIERDVQRPQQETLRKIAAAFKLTVDDLDDMVVLPRRRHEEEIAPETLALARRIDRLPPFGVAALQMMLLFMEQFIQQAAGTITDSTAAKT